MARITTDVFNKQLENILKNSRAPLFKLVPELNGIEVYFKDKPDAAIIEKLKKNHWRWHSTKKCWFTSKSAETLLFAAELCSDHANTSTSSSGKTASKLPVPPRSDSLISQMISFNMLNGNQVISLFLL